MAHPCLSCLHERRADLDRALMVEGMTYRAASKEFGISHAALQRHKAKCLGGVARKVALELARPAVESAIGGQVARDILALRAKADELGRKAEKDRDYRTALMAVRELTRLVELQERLALEAKQGQAADIQAHPAWLRLQSELLKALLPYPEAYRAVTEAVLRSLQAIPSAPEPETRGDSLARGG